MPQTIQKKEIAKPLPPIGLGTWQTDDLKSMQEAIETAVDAGYRMIDCAFVYMNEQFVGHALQRLYSMNKIRREELFITSKLPMNGLRASYVEYFLKQTLNALQTDYLDLYLIHFPVGILKGPDGDDIMPTQYHKVNVDPEVNLLETWKVMESMVDKGFVKSIGLSNFNCRQIKIIYDAARIKPANIQVECHAYLTQMELSEFCKDLNIPFTAYSPLGTPGLSDYFKEKYDCYFKTPRLIEDPKVLEIASVYGKTPAQVLLRYLVQRGMTVIPKSSNPGRIRENIQIFDFELRKEDVDILNSLNRNFRFFPFSINDKFIQAPEFPFKENKF